MQDLEEMLGVALFNRTPRAMLPTEIGTYVVEYARRTLSEGERRWCSEVGGGGATG